MKALTLILGLAAAVACGLALSEALAKANAESANPGIDIDNHVEAVWKRDGVTSAPRSSDAEFLRRAYLDVVGEPPTRVEVEVFLADKSENKRAELIERLLADPRFGENLADLWMQILRERGTNELAELGTSAGDVLAGWLAEQFNANAGFDKIARALILAEGPISANPPSAYFGLMGFPVRTADAAGMASKHFSGVQIQCAQCHDHPYDDAWTQQRFAGVAAFFAPIEVQADFYTQPIDPRVEARDVATKSALEAYLKTLKDVPPEYRGRIEDLLAYNTPQLPGDKPLKTRDAKAWRRALADWMLGAKHPTTARYMVNRSWSFLFGIGLVNPVDDFNPLNESSHPQLLAALADDFVAHGYDVKRLYRAILNSRTWQLSSIGGPRGAERWHFAGAPVRQLTAEQLFGALFKLEDGDALLQSFARQNASAYHRLKQIITLRQMQKDDPGGIKFDGKLLDTYIGRLDAMRPAWLLRRTLASQYAALSQTDEMTISETFTQSIDQALLILNGDATRRLSGSVNGSLVFAVLRDFAGTDGRVAAMYLSVLSRKPTEAEFLRARTLFESAKDAPQAAYEDLFYALVSTTEFATNH